MSDVDSRRPRPNRTFEGKTLSTRSQPPSHAQYRALLQGEAQFAERYSEVTLLGQGGMAEVFLCLDARMEREVALKRIDRGYRSRADRERFLREARIQAQLDHPAIVPVGGSPGDLASGRAAISLSLLSAA